MISLALLLSCRADTGLNLFDRPLLFAYGSWEKKATVVDGRLELRGVTPQGGGGTNLELDLSGDARKSFEIRVKFAGKPPLQRLRLMLSDDKGNSGNYDFPMADAKPGVAELTPVEGAALENPTELKDGKTLNLSKIRQWQLIGDWSSTTPFDMDVLSVRTIDPTEAILKSRADAKAKRLAEAQDRAEEARRLREQFGKVGPDSPKFEAIYAVAPDTIAIRIRQGVGTASQLLPYVPVADEKLEKQGDATVVVRNGQPFGYLFGNKTKQIKTFEKYSGDPLLSDFLADPAKYRLGDQVPVQVSRKTKPVNSVQPGYELILRHTIFLRFAKPIAAGSALPLSLGKLNVQGAPTTWKFDPEQTWSEAVKVNQVGYRPGDPLKRGFLSVWLGTGGAQSYSSPKFRVIDAAGKIAFSGEAKPTKLATEPENYNRPENQTLTDVYSLDFSPLKTGGTYRLVVDGIGASYPFEIGEDAWFRAFRTQLRGLYNNRSGTELGPPYTPFKKPVDFKPGVTEDVFQSSYSVLEGGNEGQGLAKKATTEKVPEAWGGYHDAGDWNPRRVTHMAVTAAQIELAELFPAYFAKKTWSIPNPGKLPDLLEEAKWELDLFRRLQKPDGGMPFGIETNGDPAAGEVSWNQSFPVYVYAPDVWSSWYYTAVARRFAEVARPYDPKLADAYTASAKKAFVWAEKKFAAEGGKYARWEARDARNLAAAVLVANGDATAKAAFEATTSLRADNPNLFQYGSAVQSDAAFVVARAKPGRFDAAYKPRAISGLRQLAESTLKYTEGNAWGIGWPDPGKPPMLGFFTTTGGTELLRTYELTKEEKYLTAALKTTSFSLGANPDNIVYTTGLGSNSVRNPLKIDQRHTGQATPEGLTVYGSVDLAKWNDSFFTWPITWHVSRVAVPDAYSWPTTENYMDIYLYPAMTEYTVDIWAPNVFVWGYLAARK